MCICRIINRCNSVVQFSWRQFASNDEEYGSAAAGMSDILKQTNLGLEDPMQDVLEDPIQGVPDSLSSGDFAENSAI